MTTGMERESPRIAVFGVCRKRVAIRVPGLRRPKELDRVGFAYEYGARCS